MLAQKFPLQESIGTIASSSCVRDILNISLLFVTSCLYYASCVFPFVNLSLLPESISRYLHEVVHTNMDLICQPEADFLKVLGYGSSRGQQTRWTNSRWLCTLGYSCETWRMSQEARHKLSQQEAMRDLYGLVVNAWSNFLRGIKDWVQGF